MENYIVGGFQTETVIPGEEKKNSALKNKLCINFVYNIKMPALIEIDDKIKIDNKFSKLSAFNRYDYTS